MRPGMSFIGSASPVHAAALAAMLALGGTLTGCAGTSQPPPAAIAPTANAGATGLRPVPGFLPLPDSLRPGNPGEAELMYRNPAVDPSSFDNVMLDQVRLWAPAGSPLTTASRPQQQQAARLFYSELLDALQRHCRVAQQERRNTLRFSFALVDVSAANPVALETATGGQSARASNPEPAGLGNFAATVSIEGFARDPRTGIIVWEGVERSGVGTAGSSSVSTWSDLRRIFASWADQIVTKLRQNRICT
jgi:hypothetical protein